MNKSRSEKKTRVETKKSKINRKGNGKKYREAKGVEEKVGDDYDNNDSSNEKEEESSEEMIRYRRGEKDWSDYIRTPRYTEEQKQEVDGAEDGDEDEVEGQEGDEGEEEEMRAHREGRGEPCDVTERYTHCLAWLHTLFYCF